VLFDAVQARNTNQRFDKLLDAGKSMCVQKCDDNLGKIITAFLEVLQRIYNVEYA